MRVLLRSVFARIFCDHKMIHQMLLTFRMFKKMQGISRILVPLQLTITCDGVMRRQQVKSGERELFINKDRALKTLQWQSRAGSMDWKGLGELGYVQIIERVGKGLT